MKILFITGTHPRHAYLARVLESTGCLSTLILEQRETFIPQPPKNISHELKELFKHHFQSREKTELSGFGEAIFPDVNTLMTTKEALNQSQVQSAIKEIEPDLLLTYGCHKLTNETLNCADKEKWNCHGGLSPWYKGAVTHFWPSYMLEPQMTGMTVHDLTDSLDAGDIVHQCSVNLEIGDKLHDLAVKSVRTLGQELPKLIELLKSNQNIKKQSHPSSGMLWLGSKWRAEHLELIYKHYNDDIVDHYLEGKIQQNPPSLYRQF